MTETRCAAAIIQARLGSERLPGKTLLGLAGVPVLQHVIQRLQAVESLDMVCVATTQNDLDAPVCSLCHRLGIPYFRGSEENVLGRYTGAAATFGADIIVRVTADNPLIHPPIVGELVGLIRTRPEVEYCYATNSPLGAACEAVRFDALLRAESQCKTAEHREHVTLFIREHPELFSVREVKSDLGNPDMRLTLDTAEDFELLSTVFARLQRPGQLLDVRDVIEFLNQHEAVRLLNRDVMQRRPGRPLV